MADNTQAPRCRMSQSGPSARKPVGQLAVNWVLQHVLPSTPTRNPTLFPEEKRNKLVTLPLWEPTNTVYTGTCENLPFIVFSLFLKTVLCTKLTCKRNVNG